MTQFLTTHEGKGDPYKMLSIFNETSYFFNYSLSGAIY